MLNFIEWMEDKYHEFELINHVKKPLTQKKIKNF